METGAEDHRSRLAFRKSCGLLRAPGTRRIDLPLPRARLPSITGDPVHAREGFCTGDCHSRLLLWRIRCPWLSCEAEVVRFLLCAGKKCRASRWSTAFVEDPRRSLRDQRQVV